MPRRDQAMGFCFFNNVAIAARHALDVRGLERVAIVDFDVHHGNGTEDIIAGDERVLMVEHLPAPALSVQRRRADGHQHGQRAGAAVHARAGRCATLIEEIWMPRLEAFKPQMIFISAGFDAHRDDDLGQLGLVEADYDWITEQIKDVADRHAEGRIVSCLEGGYNLGALARSVAAHLRVLLALSRPSPAPARRRDGVEGLRPAGCSTTSVAAPSTRSALCRAGDARRLPGRRPGSSSRLLRGARAAVGSVWFGEPHRRRRAVPGARAACSPSRARVALGTCSSRRCSGSRCRS